jgi:hypothetical protein
MLSASLGALGAYPGNMALEFRSNHRDVVRVPHETSMNAPLIDSWTVELWVRASEKQQQPKTGRHVNLVSFPGRHPSVTMSTDGYATASLRTSNGTWYSFEGGTQINDGQVPSPSTHAPSLRTQLTPQSWHTPHTPVSPLSGITSPPHGMGQAMR